MRTIKFRGFSNCNSQWTYGNLVIVDGKYHITDQEECEEVSDYTLVDKNSVGQFTGAIDCNGNEIYEGDILYNEQIHKKTEKYKTPIKNFVVYFDDDILGLGFKCKSTVGYKECFLMKKSRYFEVVGNTYENPEWLNQE